MWGRGLYKEGTNTWAEWQTFFDDYFYYLVFCLCRHQKYCESWNIYEIYFDFAHYGRTAVCNVVALVFMSNSLSQYNSWCSFVTGTVKVIIDKSHGEMSLMEQDTIENFILCNFLVRTLQQAYDLPARKSRTLQISCTYLLLLP